MPFELCNAPATFQCCMIAIFHELIENSMEVFMDDFSVFGSSFDHCLKNPEKMLKRCEETNLVLNWEKCHFIVKEESFSAIRSQVLGLRSIKQKLRAKIRDLFLEDQLMAISDKNNKPCGPLGGHHDIATTTRKVFEAGFYWPHIFRDAQAQAFPTNDAQNVVNFLKRLFARFGIPKALISDRGTHFCNHQVEKSMKRLYLMRKSLEVIRKFHWMILGGQFNQLSHVSSPLLSKPREY
ncbi:reverse transcriptase domain-containing protein [Tanacetum coccineum]